MTKIYFRGSREQARQVAYALARSLVGRDQKFVPVAKSVHTAIGIAALTTIQADFLVKSRGGTGEDGVKWKPLSPKYLAYGRRFGPGEKAALIAAAGLPKGHRFRTGLDTTKLTAAEKKKYDSAYRKKYNRAVLSHFPEKAKQIARQHAIAELRKSGTVLQKHVSKLSVFGSRKVDILRDTSVLFNSLSPGATGGDKVFSLLGNGVIVGTNVEYASYHQEGTQHIPARPFLPTREIPEKWSQEWLDVGLEAVAEGARQAFSQT